MIRIETLGTTILVQTHHRVCVDNVSEQMVSSSFVCPNDHASLTAVDDELACPNGHRYTCDELTGIPTLFDPERPPPFHADSWDPLGRAPTDYRTLGPDEIDPFVQSQIAATGGALYRGVELRRYPSPRFPLEAPRRGAIVVDVGAGWGRWSLAAAAQGWDVTAVDPWIDCCRALYRIATQLRPHGALRIANGDGRRLPLLDDSVDAAFSYSVLQHLPKVEAEGAFAEMLRVVKPGGTVLVQMPNVRGFRQRALVRRGMVADTAFEVRPWTYGELEALARSLAPNSWSLKADGYFTLNGQWSERRAMPIRSRVVVAASEALRRASTVTPIAIRWADSVWVRLKVP